MRNNLPNVVAFVVLSAAVITGWYLFDLDKKLFPQPEPKPAEPTPTAVPRDVRAAVVGGVGMVGPFAKPVPPPVPVPPKPAPSTVTDPKALIALGDDSFYIRALLTNTGAGVQQVVLTRFEESNRLGREEKGPDGKPRHLHLIPGYKRALPRLISVEPEYVELRPNLSADQFATGTKPGPLAFADRLSRPSYTMLHYPAKDDPVRPLDEKGKPKAEDDRYPLATLAERNWKVVKLSQPAGGEPWVVAFETELGAPYFLRLRKTYTLYPKEYDFRLSVSIVPYEDPIAWDATAGIVGSPALFSKSPKLPFRYQIAGPVGLPVEGEWYTSVYRNVYTCYTDTYDTPRRQVDDPATIQSQAGGDVVLKSNSTFMFAAVGTQYFASALAIDGPDPLEYVRAVREQLPTDPKEDLGDAGYDKDRLALYDVSFRAVTPSMDVTGALTHEYVVYNGPLKVRLLKQLDGDREVDPAVVDRYLDKYKLAMLTDSHSPNWFGRRLNNIWWTDVVISVTNLMHGLLGWLHKVSGSWGVSLILLTLMVKLCLLLPSRRQLKINVDMQAKIASVKPELDEIEAKYKGKEELFLQKQQERSVILRKAGVNQMAQLGGCVLMFFQMPILVGLYCCLQESIFFRLEPFGWIANLAAPDMVLRWGEGLLPFSDPDYRFGYFSVIPIPCSFFYLGPYFNVLPLLSVTLLYFQQRITMPPPTTEMEEQQRKMLKYMLVVSGLVFYKFAAGLSIYFIVGGIWTLIERGLIPKPKAKAVVLPAADVGKGGTPAEPPKPTGFVAKFAEKMQARLEEMQKSAEGQRQIRNDGTPPPKGPSAADKAEKRRNKKKRK